MAALIRHAVQKCSSQNIVLLAARTSMINLNRTAFAKKKLKPNPKPKPLPRARNTKFDSIADSLAAKGFLRPQKEYTPPNDVAERLRTICQRVLGNAILIEGRIEDPTLRFRLLNECCQEFQHGIPNSILHTIETIDDINKFYETPVNTTVPFDALKKQELPPNLHIQYEYHRFHPETDTMFGGISAFTKSSTIVTGLKYKKKYKGHIAKTSWP